MHAYTTLRSIVCSRPARIAAALALALGAASACAHNSATLATQRAQLKQDEAGLRQFEKQLSADRTQYRTRRAYGLQSALSRDEIRVTRDRQNIIGDKSDLSADKPDTPQYLADQRALQRDIDQEQIDRARLESDRTAGRMAAESPDSMKLYRDRQAIAGEKQDIANERREMKRGTDS